MAVVWFKFQLAVGNGAHYKFMLHFLFIKKKLRKKLISNLENKLDESFSFAGDCTTFSGNIEQKMNKKLLLIEMKQLSRNQRIVLQQSVTGNK